MNMFYVIRDNYCDYEYEIIAGSKILRKALSEMVKDVFKNRPDVDIEEIVDDIDNGGEYYDSDTTIWGDGALVDGVCRWCITEYNNKDDKDAETKKDTGV